MDSGRIVSQLVIVTFLLLFPSFSASTFIGRSFGNTDEKISNEDAVLRVPQLILKYGYPVETHHVQTKDGYILEIHRIPKKGAIPVLLAHGITDSSAGWILYGRGNSLAYMLSDLGYDVWLLNARGNRYSRNHKSLSTLSFRFWDFSFHEIGTFDLPAVFDHITDQTGYAKIHYVGYSQGCTAFFIMCSEVPEYCDRVIVMNALAPAAFLGNSKSPLIRVFSKYINQLEALTLLAGIKEFQPTNDLLAASGSVACRDRAITQVLCLNSIFFIVGYNSEQINTTSLPIMYGHLPAGVSTKQLLHFGQLVKSGKFVQYDYGKLRNLVVYGKTSPPAYNLTRVVAPVAIHYGLNDWLTVPVDVRRLSEVLPNLIEYRQVPHPKFTHGDFMFAIDVESLVYNDVVRIMQNAERKINLKSIQHPI